MMTESEVIRIAQKIWLGSCFTSINSPNFRQEHWILICSLRLSFFSGKTTD